MIALLLALSPANAQNLVGSWEFDGPTPTVDATGNFDDLVLTGASLTMEGLDLDAGEWARADNYSGPPLSSKTLVSTVRINNTAARGGSVLTVQDTSGNLFDAIVWAEREPLAWMAGSSNFFRTEDVVQPDQTNTTDFRTMAIVYDVSGTSQTITLCQDGVQLGSSYPTTSVQTFAASSQALFGLRHQTQGSGAVDATISEARIYDGVLTCAQTASAPPADCDAGQDTEVCEGARDAIDSIETLAPGTISEEGPTRLRPSTIRAELQTLKDAAVAEGCGSTLVVQNVGGTHGGGSFSGIGNVNGSLAGSYAKGAFTGSFVDGTEVGSSYGRFQRNGRLVADADQAPDRVFAGQFIRTSGTNGVSVGFELSCAVDPGDALEPWSGLTIPPFE